MPSCIRPHRQPNGLVTGPATGQIRPLAEGPELADEGGADCCAAAAAAAAAAAIARSFTSRL
jgi:hypothetical protein